MSFKPCEVLWVNTEECAEVVSAARENTGAVRIGRVVQGRVDVVVLSLTVVYVDIVRQTHAGRTEGSVLEWRASWTKRWWERSGVGGLVVQSLRITGSAGQSRNSGDRVH